MSKGIGKYKYRILVTFLMIVVNSALFLKVWYDFVSVNNQTGNLLGLGNLGMAVGAYALALYVFIKGTKGMQIGVDRKSHLLAAYAMSLFITAFSECFISVAITGQFRFFWKFLWRYMLLFAIQLVINSFLLILFVDLYRKLFPPLEIVEIYGDYEQLMMNKMNGRPDKYNVTRSVKYSDLDFNELINLANDYDAVLINDLPSHEKNKILKYCFDIGKRVYFTPKISDILVKSSTDIDLFDTPIMMCRNLGISRTQKLIKRSFDIVVSGMALIILSPVMLITAIAIKMDDGGPIFYKQKRCTENLREFDIIKFRSMIVNAESDGRPHPAGEADDRITKVGRVIRTIRIDELPQIINILKGDMSVVGPRPERIEHVKKYTEDIPEFSLRAKVKGGLTGYAQVYGRYNTSALDKLRMDIIYITEYSFLQDIRIIFETVKILLHKESTQGFSEEQQQHVKE